MERRVHMPFEDGPGIDQPHPGGPIAFSLAVQARDKAETKAIGPAVHKGAKLYPHSSDLISRVTVWKGGDELQPNDRIYSNVIHMPEDWAIGDIGGNVTEIDHIRGNNIGVFFHSAKDIAGLVSSGQRTLGITGSNNVDECNAMLEFAAPFTASDARPSDLWGPYSKMELTNMRRVAVLEKLGFAKCSLEIAVPKNSLIIEENDLWTLLQAEGIASSHPYTLRQYLTKKGVEGVKIWPLSGKVEAAGVPICDLVETGRTMEANGLRSVHKISDAEAVLVGRQEDRDYQNILQDLKIGNLYAQREFEHRVKKVTNAIREDLDLALDSAVVRSDSRITTVRKSVDPKDLRYG